MSAKHTVQRTRKLCALLTLGLSLTAAEEPNIQLASFDQVWQTVHDRHWDSAKVGPAWDRERLELRPQAEQAHSAEQLRPVIEKLLATLSESHFGIIPAEAYEARISEASSGNGLPEFEFRILNGEAVVTHGAGDVKSGWVIVKVADREIASVLDKVKAATLNEREALLYGWAALRQLLRGEASATKSVTFGLPNGETRRFDVPLKEAGRAAQFGNLPPIAMQIESKALENEIAYFRFSVFFDPEWLQAELGKAVRGCTHCAGFVLDLRGNLGGLVALTPAIAGWFVPASSAPVPVPAGTVISLGTIATKSGNLKLAINPRLERFTGKLAVLVDTCSVSSAEILAAGLKDLGRARVFGEVTQGAALPSEVQKLPNGDRFQFAIADYISAGGQSVEGSGVIPHVIVRPTRNDYLNGHDPALDAALSWINTKEKSQ